MNVTKIDIFSISVISLVLTLAIYHIFIYFGRKGSDRIYYVYFSLFALNIAVYILSSAMVSRFIFPTLEIRQRFSPAITGITYFLLLHYALQIFKILLHFPASRSRVFRPFYYSFIGYWLLVLTYLYFDYEFYYAKIFPIICVFAAFSPFYMFFVFISHILKQKTRDKAQVIIFFGFIVFMFDFVAEEVIQLFGVVYPFKGTYFVSGISVLLWALALAVRFNNEYKELQSLKLSLEAKVKERTQELEIAIEERTNTFINLAHEVRTPLTLVSNYIDEQIKKHGQTREMNIINENANKLVRDIANFFVEEKFRKGIIPYDHNQIVNLSKFVADLSEMYEGYAKRKGITLTADVGNGIFIKADPDALSSLINNLVENSIKYTDENGSIWIKLTVKESSLKISVKDTGHGIPEAMQEKIFDPRFQVSGKKQNFQGIGMGLSIVNGIVQSLGGSIYLKSEENVGTEFTIELKRHKADEHEFVTDKIPQLPVNITFNKVNDEINEHNCYSVLVIDDHLQMLQFICDELKGNYNVYVAENGKKALEKLRNIPRPDLIISDVMMDDVDGIDLLKAIREDNNLRHIPFIFLTAKSSAIDRYEGLSLGAIDYIQKPFKIDELKIKIDSVIKTFNAQRGAVLNSAFEFISEKLGKPVLHVVNKKDIFEQNCIRMGMSFREKDVILALQDGLQSKDIASKLNISHTTVNKHIQNIYKKAGVSNKNELIEKLYYQ